MLSYPYYTILVPAYNESKSLHELCSRITAIFTKMHKQDKFEILIIDDGSCDETPQVLAMLASTYSYIRGVTLRRNCGKSMALMVGFQISKAEVLVTLDADLQDCPEDIPALLEKLESGYDLVSGWRRYRKDTAFRRIGSRLYNATTRRISALDIHDFNCGLKAYKKNTVSNLLIFGQYHRYIPLIVHLLGFRVGEVPVANAARLYGESKFKSFRYEGIFDLLSILFINKFGLNPLHFFGKVALFLAIPSILVLVTLFASQGLYWLGAGSGFMVHNRPMLSFALSSLLASVVIFLTGFVCDFILHHEIHKNIKHIASQNISSVYNFSDYNSSGGRLD